jgi:hypothetical protein
MISINPHFIAFKYYFLAALAQRPWEATVVVVRQ